jgi:dienelactone hydrolase
VKRAQWALGLGLMACLGLSSVCSVCAAGPTVAVPSLDTTGGAALMLPGHWFPAPQAAGAGATPALVLLHGCGGFFDRQGRIGARYLDLVARLNAMGVHALAVDSLTPRGETELCTQRLGSRQVTMTQRRRDALGAVAWLAAQTGVDAARIGVLGWSNGGSTVLAATNGRHREVQAAAVKPALAVAFYPGCDTELGRGYEPVAPLLMLLGEADDWTPAAACKQLAGSVSASMPAVQWQAYDGAYHGFDGTAPVRLRKDVPNGVNPGAGVHVGGDPAARAASAQRLQQFLNDVWKLKP